jgi:hypothetical protein
VYYSHESNDVDHGVGWGGYPSIHPSIIPSFHHNLPREKEVPFVSNGSLSPELLPTITQDQIIYDEMRHFSINQVRVRELGFEVWVTGLGLESQV